MSLTMPPPDEAVLARRGAVVAALRAIVPGEGVIEDGDALRAYESDALTAYRQRPLRHEYRLTDKGAALFTVIVGLKQWGDRFGPAAKNGKPMELVDRADGHALEPALIDVLTGRRLELTNVRAVAGAGAVQATRDFFDRLALTRPSQR